MTNARYNLLLLQVTCCVLFFSCLGDASAGTPLTPEVYRAINPEIPSDYQPVLKGPTPKQADSLQAEKFFVKARLFAQSEKYSEAIRCYERAWRYSPCNTILSQVVSLTAHEQRIDEMARYFAKLKEPEKLDVLVLRQVGLLLTLDDRIEEAVTAYEAALKSLPADQFPDVRIALRHELGRLYYLIERYPEAILCFELVEKAVNDPKRFDMEDEILESLKEERALSLFLLTDCYLLTDENDRAAETLEKAVQLEKEQLKQKGQVAQKETQNQQTAESEVGSASEEGSKAGKEASRGGQTKTEALPAPGESSGTAGGTETEEAPKSDGTEVGKAPESVEEELEEATDEELAELEMAVKAQVEAEAEEDAKDAPKTLEEIESKANFVRARIAYNSKRYEDARALLEKVLDAKFHEEGKVPYSLYESTLSALNKTDELIPQIERYYALDSDNVELGYFLAELYLKAARPDATRKNDDVRAQKNLLAQAEKLLEKLSEKTPKISGYVGLLEIAVLRNDAESFLHVLYNILSQHETEELAGTVLIALNQRLYPTAAPAPADGEEPAKADTDAENPTQTKTEEKANRASKDAKPTFDDVRLAELKDVPLQEFLKKTVQFADSRYHTQNAKIPWQLFWSVGFLAKQVGEQEISDRFYQSAQSVLVRLPLNEKTTPSATFFLERGRDLLVLDRLDKALGLFRLGLKSVSPEDEMVTLLYYYEASVLMLKKDLPAAIRYLTPIVEKTKSVFLRQQLGRMHFLFGDLDQAAGIYQAILDENTEYGSPQQRDLLRECRTLLSSVESYRGNFDHAEELLEQVLDEFPDDPGARNDLAYLWATEKKNLHRALLMAQEAVAAEPESYAYLDTLGWVHFLLGELEDAERCLAKANEKETDPVLLSHLGDLHLAKGKPEEAKACFQKALVLFDENQQKNELVDKREKKHVEERLDELSRQ